MNVDSNWSAANAMFTKLGVNWASSLLGFLAIAFIPIPFLLYRVSIYVPHMHFLHY